MAIFNSYVKLPEGMGTNMIWKTWKESAQLFCFPKLYDVFVSGNIWGNISENYMGNMFDDIFGKTYSKGSYEKVPGVPKVIFDIWGDI